MGKKSRKTLDIKGYNFNVIETENLQGFERFITLFECYNKPSKFKQEIYKKCLEITTIIEDYFDADVTFDCGVTSYNVNVFTFGANLTKNGELIAVYYETKTRREIYIKKGFEI